jgi:hypothetical protein
MRLSLPLHHDTTRVIVEDPLYLSNASAVGDSCCEELGDCIPCRLWEKHRLAGSQAFLPSKIVHACSLVKLADMILDHAGHRQ